MSQDGQCTPAECGPLKKLGDYVHEMRGELKEEFKSLREDRQNDGAATVDRMRELIDLKNAPLIQDVSELKRDRLDLYDKVNSLITKQAENRVKLGVGVYFGIAAVSMISAIAAGVVIRLIT
ncbi:MAG: hypothetical protein JRE23_14990 [Deltaproteobacteria bacterium]|nr:hypothetical protein [Deltaproteobacteria bacterium]